VNNAEFSELLQQKGAELYRNMPWREDTRPYYVLVSELMLQQTQVDRVIPKFNAFIERFPDEAGLAKSSLADVLTMWSGLGYNRRAKFLHETAKRITYDFHGNFPVTKELLLTLPGVGEGTAGAILNYAFNKPTVFIETNVRTVYFHHFFTKGDLVTDGQIAEKVAQTIDTEHPREFYWAIMDYGTWLKKNGASRIAQSAHYKKQAPLKGSVREVRGQIIRLLTGGDLSLDAVALQLKADERFSRALDGLMRDGLVTETDQRLHLTK